MPSSNWDRLFRTKPEATGGPQSAGVAFVSILFGVVTGLLVLNLAGEVRAMLDARQEVREPRLLHLCVGMALAVLSFLGYYFSQNRPQHRIKFFNLPLCMFLLDVLMVFAYYVVLTYTESPEGAREVTRTDARPEAFAIAFAFLLYTVWDVVSWRLDADPLYQAAIDSPTSTDFGTRRMVTIWFLVLSVAAALVIWGIEPHGPGPVVAIDLVLILLLIAFRVAKSYWDPHVETRPRGGATGQTPPR